MVNGSVVISTNKPIDKHTVRAGWRMREMKARGSQEREVEGLRGPETGDDEPLQRQREIKMEMRRHQKALWSPTRPV